jgi:type IX secretion system substrate protein
MKKRTFTLQRRNIISKILTLTFLSCSSTLFAQIYVNGCSDGVYNGTYNTIVTECASCQVYEKSGGGAYIYRFAINTLIVSGNTVIDCNAVTFAMQNDETDCDPSNGGTYLNGCLISSTPAPVEMSWFEAKAIEKNVYLNWEVASEINNEGFEVERSTDGRSFTTLGFVEGRGDATDPMEYFYQDFEVTQGEIYYYRLKQLDFDGKYEYSDIVSVVLANDAIVAGEFYPNPTLGATAIDFYSLKNSEWNVEVYSLSGQLLWRSTYQLTKGKNALHFNFSEFGTGLYFVKFENNLERIYRKLSVQH